MTSRRQDRNQIEDVIEEDEDAGVRTKDITEDVLDVEDNCR